MHGVTLKVSVHVPGYAKEMRGRGGNLNTNLFYCSTIVILYSVSKMNSNLSE